MAGRAATARKQPGTMLFSTGGLLCLALAGPPGSPDDPAVHELVLVVLGLFPTLYLGAFIHELGHALFGRWAGFRVTSFGMGVARPFLIRKWGGARVYLARSNPLQGITFALHPELLAARRAFVPYLAGGAFLQGVFALLLLGLAWLTPWGWFVCLLGGVAHGVGALINLVPIRFSAGPFMLRSDGALIVQVLRQGVIDVPPRDHIHMLSGLRGLWKEVGDTLMLRMCLLGVAQHWLALDSLEAARQAWEEAEALPVEPSWAHAYSALAQGEIAVRSGALDVANDAFERAEHLFAQDNHTVGLFLTALGRVDLQQLRGDEAGALARLAELLHHPVVAHRPFLRGILQMSQLICRASVPGADLAVLETEFGVIRRRHTSLVLERRFFVALARAAAAGGDGVRALRAFRAALSATRELYAGWTDEESGETFVAGQAQLLADARACLEQQGLANEAEQLGEMFLPPQESRRRQHEAAEMRTRRQHQLGRLLALVSLAAGGVCGLFAVFGRAPGYRFVGVAVMLAVNAMLTLLTSYGLQGVGRLFGEFRRSLGWLPWLFLLGGWIGAIVLLFLIPH